MKIKVDENLSLAHRRILEAAGHDVADVYDERLAGASDDVLWSHVCEEGRSWSRWTVRTIHPSVSAVAMILRRVVEERDLTSLAACLVVADEVRTRVRVP